MGLVRTNNEDNLQIARDLSVEPMRWINDEACLLTPCGSLLVVADGMGGMNAGEVASQIAVDTVKEVFSPAALSGVNLGSTAAVNAHIAAAVVEADRRIKATAKVRPETRGMGTTIVIAWLLGGKLHIGWCGDSRAYLFNAATGLRRLSKDHSYVQTLVDAGKLTEEQAFDYPQSNIITRCLSDSGSMAKADVLPEPVTVADGDIILLCTDGLCGMLRDRQIETIMRDTLASGLSFMAKALIDGALAAGGADNVTIALQQIMSGGVKPERRVLPAMLGGVTPEVGATGLATTKFKGSAMKRWIPFVLAGIVAGIIITLLYFTLRSDKESGKQVVQTEQISGGDSIPAAPTVQETVTQPENSQEEIVEGAAASPHAANIGNNLSSIASKLEADPGKTEKTTVASESSKSSTNDTLKTTTDVKLTSDTLSKTSQNSTTTPNITL